MIRPHPRFVLQFGKGFDVLLNSLPYVLAFAMIQILGYSILTKKEWLIDLMMFVLGCVLLVIAVVLQVRRSLLLLRRFFVCLMPFVTQTQFAGRMFVPIACLAFSTMRLALWLAGQQANLEYPLLLGLVMVVLQNASVHADELDNCMVLGQVLGVAVRAHT